MANAIDNDIRSYRGILDPSLAPKDGYPEEIVKKAIENANNLLNRT
ncbi:MAG: hypothetical protein MJ200_05875 [Mycoplasmoidaceae bacterium]|nr:hypothetical protein [Mycoplasmoidaceae bacterium]